jgi:uncharacterized membrane protein
MLIGANLIYASVSLATKFASNQSFLSFTYLAGVACALGIMALYAVVWQQIIAHVELSFAYMFKGTSLIFILLFSYFFFRESITLNNIIGTVIIISGITLFAKTS